MRISSWMLYQTGINGILDRQAELAKLQQQIASGRKLQTAADDPAGAAIALNLERGLADITQWNRNAERLRSRLAREETTLGEIGNVLTRVRELALTGANATQSSETRSMLATELRQIHSQLLELANTRDESGRYIFGGYQDGSAPFVKQGDSVVFTGDAGERRLQIGPSRELGDTDSGYEVFMRTPGGNGDFRVSSGANNGDIIITGAELRDRAAWSADDYTLDFAADGSWQVRDGGGAVIANGMYEAGQPISFRGVELRFEGQPAAGDSFQVSAASSRDMFGIVQDLIDAFATPASNAADHARMQNIVFTALEELDGQNSNILSARAGVGARLAAVDQQLSINESAALEIEQARSNIVDLDYAKAISEMQMKLAGLQASQQSFVRIQGLKLFDFLR